MTQKTQILIVEDELLVADDLKEMLKRNGVRGCRNCKNRRISSITRFRIQS